MDDNGSLIRSYYEYYRHYFVKYRNGKFSASFLFQTQFSLDQVEKRGVIDG